MSEKAPLGSRKALLFAGALHVAGGAGLHEKPRIEQAGREAAQFVRNTYEHVKELPRIEYDRSHMLREAREAQEQHRPWAGHFMIRMWFVEKRAVHERYRDEPQLQQAYTRVLENLRTRLEGQPRDVEHLHAALTQVLNTYDYWGGAGEAHFVDILREQGGNCEAIGPFIASLLVDLNIPGVGLRRTFGDPESDVPYGHIAPTIRLPIHGRMIEFDLQTGGPVDQRGVYVPTDNLLSQYERGSIHLAFPQAQPGTQRNSPRDRSPSLTAYQRYIMGPLSSEPGAGSGSVEESLDEGQAARLIADRETLLQEVETRLMVQTPHPLLIGNTDEVIPSETHTPFASLEPYTRQEWLTASRTVVRLLRLAEAEKKFPNIIGNASERLVATYAILSEFHEVLREQAISSGRNALAQRMEHERDHFFARSRAHLEAEVEYTSLNNLEQRSVLRLHTPTRRGFLDNTQRQIQDFRSVNGMHDTLVITRIVDGFKNFLGSVPDRDLRQRAISELEAWCQDPFIRGQVISHLNSDTLGDHALVHEAAVIRRFVTTGELLRDVTSTVDFERAVERSFHQYIPNAPYKAAYFFAIFDLVVQQRSADQAYQLLQLYEHDQRFPPDYIRHLMDARRPNPMMNQTNRPAPSLMTGSNR